MDRSYKIYKSYHTSHHNTTKTHLQISTPPSSVQQHADIHNLPPNHMESQPSKLQASSNAPTLTTSPANHKETQPLQPSSAALMAHPLPANHHSLTPPKTRTDRLPAGRLPVRSSLPPFLPPTQKKSPQAQTPRNSPKTQISNYHQSLPVVTNHHPTRSRNF